MINHRDFNFAPSWFVDLIKTLPHGAVMEVSRKIKETDNRNRLDVLFSQNCIHFLEIFLKGLESSVDLEGVYEYLRLVRYSKIERLGFGFEKGDNSDRWKIYLWVSEIDPDLTSGIAPKFRDWQGCFYRVDIGLDTTFQKYMVFLSADREIFGDWFPVGLQLFDCSRAAFVRVKGSELFIYFEPLNLKTFIDNLGFYDSKLNNLTYKGLKPYLIGFPYSDLATRKLTEVNLYYY
jgi:hypothetical protein